VEISALQWVQQVAVLIRLVLVVVLIPVVSIQQPAVEASILQQRAAVSTMSVVSMLEAWMPAVSMPEAWTSVEISVREAASPTRARMAAASTLAQKECGNCRNGSVPPAIAGAA